MPIGPPFIDFDFDLPAANTRRILEQVRNCLVHVKAVNTQPNGYELKIRTNRFAAVTNSAIGPTAPAFNLTIPCIALWMGGIFSCRQVSRFEFASSWLFNARKTQNRWSAGPQFSWQTHVCTRLLMPFSKPLPYGVIGHTNTGGGISERAPGLIVCH